MWIFNLGIGTGCLLIYGLDTSQVFTGTIGWLNLVSAAFLLGREVEL